MTILIKSGDTYGPFQDYLIEAAPEILWFKIDDSGDYQGTVWALGLYKKSLVMFTGSYGSCSGCGAWGEGGEPRDLEEVMAYSLIEGIETDKWSAFFSEWSRRAAVGDLPIELESPFKGWKEAFLEIRDYLFQKAKGAKQ